VKKYIAPPENFDSAPLIVPASFSSAWSSVLIAHLSWLANEAIWDGDATEALRAAQQMAEILILLGLEQVEDEMPIGVCVPYAGSAAPPGWLLCDGSAISRVDYANLFAICGTAYGVGNGTTTFNIPDMRGRFPLGKDNMGGSSANRVTATEADNLGQGSGAESEIITIAKMPAHSHNQRLQTNFASTFASFAQVANAASPATAVGTIINTSDAGGGEAHNNMPPYLTLNFIIAFE
jgi:microcystin-dependent protein